MAHGKKFRNKVISPFFQPIGKTETPGSTEISVLLKDSAADVLHGRGATVPGDGETGYAVGTIFIDTTGGVGVTLYMNEGSNTSCDFNAITTSAGASVSYDNINDAGANGSIAFAGFTNTWTSTLDTGTFFTISNLDSDLSGQTNLVDLKFADDGDSDGVYFRCLDNVGADVKFTIGVDGATVITGAAAGTAALTLTLGDIAVTSGDVAIAIGVLTVADTANSLNKISRNNATGTAPVLEVEQTHATGGVAYLVDQNATGDVNAFEITNAGTGFSLSATGGAAASQGFEFISAAAATAKGILLDGSTGSAAWIGAANIGFLQIQSDGVLAQTTASLIQVLFTGTSTSGGLGTCMRLVDTSTSGGGTEYVAYISSTNSEALHIDSGKVQIDEAVTLGVNDLGADLLCYGATSGMNMLWDESADTLKLVGGAKTNMQGTLTVGVNATGYDVKFFGDTTGKFMVWDQSADDLILADGVALQLGGDESTVDGFKLEFDGTSTLALDALTADNQFIIGAGTDTDLVWNDTTGAALTCDASGNSITVAAATKLVVVGDSSGDGTDGLEIPFHATVSPGGTPGTGSIIFEVDAKKLWIYDGSSFVGVVLS